MTDSSPLRPAALGDVESDALASWAEAVEAWPVGSHVWGQYAEQIGERAAVCRTENVSACHSGVAALVASERDGRSRISTLADFDGVEVAGGDPVTDHCTHEAMGHEPTP